uniref:Uncharacterized protein n=1 Tax=Coccidioides posadasii RMSCC 3488 TaxID=454284 RepID=A0A0J6I8K4_COCPO|nr:hypothetical protein CPAG_04175 [Coccidioides posadasii RMSCC 3488]
MFHKGISLHTPSSKLHAPYKPMSSHIKPKQNQQAKSKQFCILSRLFPPAIPLSASPIIPTRPGTSHTKLGSWTSICHGVGLEARIFLVSIDAKSDGLVPRSFSGSCCNVSNPSCFTLHGEISAVVCVSQNAYSYTYGKYAGVNGTYRITTGKLVVPCLDDENGSRSNPHTPARPAGAEWV